MSEKSIPTPPPPTCSICGKVLVPKPTCNCFVPDREIIADMFSWVKENKPDGISLSDIFFIFLFDMRIERSDICWAMKDAGVEDLT